MATVSRRGDTGRTAESARSNDAARAAEDVETARTVLTNTDRSDPSETVGPSPSRRWTALRLGLGATYLLGGIAHLALWATDLSLYESFADVALVGAYTDLWNALVVPNLQVLVPLVGLFELAIGVGLLWRGRAVRVAHVGGAAFQAALVLSGPWGPVNAVLALAHLAAMRVPAGRTVLDVIRRR